MPDPIQIVKAKLPEIIPVYDAPPALGGKCRYLTPSELNTEFGIQCHEGLFVDNEESLALLQSLPFHPLPGVDYTSMQRQVARCLKIPFGGLALAKINDDVGYGVFAERAIPKGTVLCLYSGIIHIYGVPAKKLEGDEYLANIDRENQLFICASHYRGMSGFMQHLPSNHERTFEIEKKHFEESDESIAAGMGVTLDVLKQARRNGIITDKIISDTIEKHCRQSLKTDPEWANISFIEDTEDTIERTVASSNIRQELIPYNGSYVLALVTQLPIKKGEIIGYSYSNNYWVQKGERPELFSRHGQIVPRSLYQYNVMFTTLPSKYGEESAIILNRERMQHTIDAREPLDLGDGEGMSPYPARTLLVRNGFLAKCYDAQPDDTLVIMLKKHFAKMAGVIKVDVQLFWQYPKNVEALSTNTSTYSTEIICTAEDETSFKALSQFFSDRELEVIHNPQTLEIILDQANEARKREIYRCKLS